MKIMEIHQLYNPLYKEGDIKNGNYWREPISETEKSYDENGNCTKIIERSPFAEEKLKGDMPEIFDIGWENKYDEKNNLVYEGKSS